MAFKSASLRKSTLNTERGWYGFNNEAPLTMIPLSAAQLDRMPQIKYYADRFYLCQNNVL